MNVEEYYAQLIDALWHKNFLLASPQYKQLWSEQPPISAGDLEQFYEQLTMIKNQLHSVKSAVHDMVLNVQNNNHINYDEALARWRSYTSFTHPMRKLPRQILIKCYEILDSKASITSQPVTQAYCKFLQIASVNPAFINRPANSIDGRFRSLHLCESPGGFILALKHFLGPHCTHWDWRVNSLNPHFEYHYSKERSNSSTGDNKLPTSQFLNDDLLILGNEKRVAFGWDESGDILQWDQTYIEKLVKETDDSNGNRNTFHLVTADGGIDCTDEPSDQENRIRPLIEQQIRIACQSLHPGGNFLLKAYTFFERETINLLAILCASFTYIYCLKPPSSKPGNSEVYLLCLDYRQSNLPSITLSAPFLKRIIECVHFFTEHQMDFIKFNLRTFRRLSHLERSKIEMQKCMAQEVMAEFLWQKIQSAIMMQKNTDGDDALVWINDKAPWHGIWNCKADEYITERKYESHFQNNEMNRRLVIESTEFFQWLNMAEKDNFDEILKEGLAFSRISNSKNNYLINKPSSSLFVPNEWLISKNCSDICCTNPTYHSYYKSSNLPDHKISETRVNAELDKQIRMNWLNFLLEQSNPNHVNERPNMDVMRMSLEDNKLTNCKHPDAQLLVDTMPNKWIVSRFSASAFIVLFALFERVDFFGGDCRHFCFYGRRENEKLLIHQYLLAVKNAASREKLNEPTGALLMRFVPTRIFAQIKDFHSEIVNFNKCVFYAQQFKTEKK